MTVHSKMTPNQYSQCDGTLSHQYLSMFW